VKVNIHQSNPESLSGQGQSDAGCHTALPYTPFSAHNKNLVSYAAQIFSNFGILSRSLVTVVMGATAPCFGVHYALTSCKVLFCIASGSTLIFRVRPLMIALSGWFFLIADKLNLFAPGHQEL
jgi:hypothetical protein